MAQSYYSEFYVAGWGDAMEFTVESKLSLVDKFSDLFLHPQELWSYDMVKEYTNVIEKLTQNASGPLNLKKVQVLITRNDKTCLSPFESKNIKSSKHICAKNRYVLEGPTSGDSGSPLMRFDLLTEEIEIIGLGSQSY